MRKKSENASNTGAAKKKLRNKILASRRKMSAAEIKKISAAIERNLKKAGCCGKSKKIMYFVSKKGEIDTVGMIKRRLAVSEVFVPKVSGRRLDVYAIKNFSADLSPGRFGILEPNENAVKRSINDVDVVLVPALAYDRRGYRIGYGGGYYDRLLARIARKKRVGLINSKFLQDKIPIAEHDVPVGMIVTEKGILKIGNRERIGDRG